MRRDIFDLKGMDDLNVTPLLDLAWTLLVVFVIAITAAVQGIKVNLPKASKSVSLSKPRTKAITLTTDGQIYLDAYPVTMEQLETSLRQFKAADPDLPVIIKGEDKIYYQAVISVLDLLGRLEITQLGLVTQTIVK